MSKKERISEHESTPLTTKGSATRLVKNYVVYTDEFLGKGQYGIVCKAKLASEVKDPNAKVFACKMMEV